MDMRVLMKQAQQMQAKMAETQAKLQEETAEATSGGGMVTVVANGKGEILSLKIKKEVVDPNDVEMLEDLVIGAANEALRMTRERLSAEMGKITGGMNMPGIF
jgi:DNA-binding YbaB/EbfC family protein